MLDVYAGTGALGLESLSRGAASAVFVDSEGAACKAILQSIARAGCGEKSTVVRGRLPGAINQLTGRFDLVLMDPPYQAESAEETLMLVAPLVAAGGLVVYEHASRYNPPERPQGLVLTERRVYGDTAIALYAPKEGE